MKAAFELARELSLDLREEELVGTFAATLARSCPGDACACASSIRARCQLTSMVADGPLAARLPMQAAPLAIKRSALRRTRLPDAITLSARVRVFDVYERVFAAVGGRAASRCRWWPRRELFGLLNVEYPQPHELADVDEPVVIPLANQLSVALRNLNLLGEARYYRDYLRKMIDVANALIVVIDRDARIAVMNARDAALPRLRPDIIGTPLGGASRKALDAPEPRLATLMLDGRCAASSTRRRGDAAGGADGRLRAPSSTPRCCAPPTAPSTASSPSARTSSACARSSARSSRRRSSPRSGSSPRASCTSSTTRSPRSASTATISCGCSSAGSAGRRRQGQARSSRARRGSRS